MNTPAAATAALIVHGGPILTMETAQPRAEAIAIANGQILAVGEKASVMALAGPHTRVVDLAGRALLPGFIDAHGHFANALQVVSWANIQRPPAGPVRAIADLQAALQAHAQQQHLASGDWVIAYGYDPDGLSDGRPLDKADLDGLFPTNPVMVIHNSNHGAVTAFRTTSGQLGFALGFAASGAMANGFGFANLRTRLLDAGVGPEAIPALVNRVRTFLSTGVLPARSPKALETVIHQAYASGLAGTLLVVAAVVLLLGVISLLLLAIGLLQQRLESRAAA